MTAPSTARDFLDVLAKSRLLGERPPHDCEDGVADPTEPGSAGRLAEGLVAAGRLTRFQADHLLQGKWLRFFVGPYKVLRPLGTGSAGAVYLCEHTKLNRRVAVKVLLATAAQSRAGLERFYREARAAAALDHPNIVHAFDVGREDRLHYLAMEYVDGANLQEVIRTHGPLRQGLAAGYLRQAARGLGHALAAGLIHRDLKPSNLMVTRKGVVKILDLGLARFHEDDGGNLTRGDVLGVEDYIAPEQVLDSHSVDVRADIYSLGATFYFVLTGRKPPRSGVPAPRPGVPRNAPADLLDVLNKMMAQDPEDRYQTPAEVEEAAARLTSPTDVGTASPAPKPLTSPRPKSRAKPAAEQSKVGPKMPGRETSPASAQPPAAMAEPFGGKVLWAVAGVLGVVLAFGLLLAEW